MANVLVVTSAPPLIEGGHLVIARALERALRDAGHQAAIVTTPSNRFGRQASAYLANWMTDVSQTGAGERVDQVISLRFPSYAVRHPRHVSWLNHTMREYYDLWDDFAARLSPQGRLKERMRRALIHAVDSRLLGRLSKVFAQSRTVQERLARWNHVSSEVLYPPPPQRPYRVESYGDYLFFASRLAPLKRADLVLRALAQPEAAAVRLVLGGEGEELGRLRILARELDLDARVTFTGRLDEASLVDHLARSRAVVFVPKQEDYGFVTVEAFASGRPVITATDSGGPAELVRDGENGFVTPPEPRALARAFAALMDSPRLAERMGAEGLKDVASLTWPKTVEKLILTDAAPARTDRRP
jgi:glycosyltransferase involved in cell wall biosynthesis